MKGKEREREGGTVRKHRISTRIIHSTLPNLPNVIRSLFHDKRRKKKRRKRRYKYLLKIIENYQRKSKVILTLNQMKNFSNVILTLNQKYFTKIGNNSPFPLPLPYPYLYSHPHPHPHPHPHLKRDENEDEDESEDVG